MKRRFRRCGHAPGALSPEDQAVVDQFRAMLTAMRDPQPWTPGSGQDVARRPGPGNHHRSRRASTSDPGVALRKHLFPGRSISLERCTSAPAAAGTLGTEP
jgi:hypothetical protein